MLISIALILIPGLLLGFLCSKIKLPALVGMLAVGIVIGPYALNLLDTTILDISPQIRKIALIIILTRAGLGLDMSSMKKVGRPALLMCFIPASFEIAGMLCLGPCVLGLNLMESALLGSVLAAVSPAVVVPRMVKLIDEGYGTKKGIPQMILAGASVDDVYVIVLFTTFASMMQGKAVDIWAFVNIPASIVLGIVIGLICGRILAVVFRVSKMRKELAMFALLCCSFLLVAAEDALMTPISFSSLIAIMFMGIAIRKYEPDIAQNLSGVYNKLWIPAEVFLFVLVGACVDVRYIGNIGVMAIIAVFGAIAFRMFGVFLCLIRTGLKGKEKLFTMMAYTPKATVQAAIGSSPLSLGLTCGNMVLTVAVLAIIVTAPLGAFAIDSTYRHFLKKGD
ncbi:MAG: cation:proton antiporter [Lachnospiraceae bacterium]|nr:cation:proton antiporter [Candidatus Merdinaster equi]